MPTITKIIEQKRRANRRNVYLDGAFAFGLSDNVVARFRLREGMTLSEEQMQEIAKGEVRQECFDFAMKHLQARLHSAGRSCGGRWCGGNTGIGSSTGCSTIWRGWGTWTTHASRRPRRCRRQSTSTTGRRRAFVELLKAGVKKDVADAALDDVYEKTDSTAAARLLAEKQAPSLRRLEPAVARRRLAGMLMRRGFDYETIRPVIDQVLGGAARRGHELSVRAQSGASDNPEALPVSSNAATGKSSQARLPMKPVRGPHLPRRARVMTVTVGIIIGVTLFFTICSIVLNRRPRRRTNESRCRPSRRRGREGRTRPDLADGGDGERRAELELDNDPHFEPMPLPTSECRLPAVGRAARVIGVRNAT